MEKETIELIKQLPKNVTSINFIDGKIESIYFDVEKDSDSSHINSNARTLSNLEHDPITEIKKGDRFLCIKDFIMDNGLIAYSVGLKYSSDFDKCITDNKSNTSHYMGFSSIEIEATNEYFIKIN